MRSLYTALVLGVTLSAAPAALSAQATTSVEREVETIEEFSEFNPCGIEAMTIVGTITTTVRLKTDARGLTHESISVLTHVEGVGESGAKYVIRFPERTTDSYVAGDDFPRHRNYTLAIHLVGQGKAPNLMVKYNLHVTIQADGTVTHEIEKASERCLAA